MKNKLLKWALPLIIFIAIAPFTPTLDLAIARFFYENGSFQKNGFLTLFYKWGTWPAWLAAGFFIWKLKVYKKFAVLYIATFALGAGFFTNALLKNFWQRPRPVQTLEFGGFSPYHTFWTPLTENLMEPCRSFPCGHATMGFIFITLCMIGYRTKDKILFYSGVFLTLFLGLGLSITRIAQGGHYFSDTLASFLVMWLTTISVDAYLFKRTRYVQFN